MTLTVHQQEVLAFMRDYIAEHRRPPRLREIAAQIGRRIQTVDEHVRALARKGVVLRTNDGLRLADDPRWPAEAVVT